MALSFSVARFTYAPDESCPTADAAIATRSPIDWICYNPQATLSLVIDQTPGGSLMKFIDGEYIYVYPHLRITPTSLLTVENMGLSRDAK
jgi:hypothetical protein